MATSKISWCDRVWNPVVGCTRVSAGCENCYAEALAPRLAAMGQPAYQNLTKRHADGSVNWTGEVKLLHERLRDPLRWRKPTRVFVNSMSDLFHDAVTDEFIWDVFAVMALAPQHTFQVLTKRPERMLRLLGDPNAEGNLGFTIQLWRPTPAGSALSLFIPWPLPNVWLGVSTENQETAEARIPILLRTPAAVRFISAEPLLEDIGIAEYLTPGWHPSALDWVIAGAESGIVRRHYDKDWARSIRDQCVQACVPFFYKQGSSQWPGQDDMLDGREWREFPQ